ncbi:hypothetical protein LAV_00009 [Sphingobium phage Lacusarx]|uniref:Uncharacterized protein n=1 Tax=Sphingobium phage Lacusarx TaxID=1980139 RepID=A0A1W6DWZ1_9CAUD|nr:hypothetical protein FDH44_gp009 [Sphingobium phage Lacusarx]ARK07409.1 hypothetical protein LAV_00009 [Sphingobium phage Lacusarx]
MAKMNSKFKYMYDAAPASALIVKDHVAKTASFNGPALVLDKVLGYWNDADPILADSTVAIAINVEAADTTTGDETYELELEAGPVGFATSVKTHKVTVTGPGQYVVLVDFDTLKAMKADVAAIRIAATLAGTTPSLTAHAWIAGAIIR